MTRVWRIMRIQLVNAPAVLLLPLGILAIIVVVNILLFGAVNASAEPQDNTTGALAAIYAIMLVTHLQTMTQVFPFALGLGVTRRSFFAATGLIVVGQAVGYGIVLYLCSLVEQATNGWGVTMTFFRVSFIADDPWPLQPVEYAVPLLAMAFLGVLVGVVFSRWGRTGVWIMTTGTGLVISGAVILATWQQWWPAVGRFFTEQPSLALTAGYPLALAALFAGLGYRVLRRTTA